MKADTIIVKGLHILKTHTMCYDLITDKVLPRTFSTEVILPYTITPLVLHNYVFMSNEPTVNEVVFHIRYDNKIYCGGLLSTDVALYERGWEFLKNAEMNAIRLTKADMHFDPNELYTSDKSLWSISSMKLEP